MSLPRSRGLAWVALTIVVATVADREVIAQSRLGAEIVVRSYNTFGVPLRTMEQAELTATRLFDNADIGSRWRNCQTKNGPMRVSKDNCHDVLNALEVSVRIVVAPKTIIDPQVLGYSHVDSGLRRGVLATVFADRVRTLALRLNFDEGELLGRAIGHEIGHLLLGTSAHSPTGLMRGHWLLRDFGDWTFSSGEAAQMQDGLALRAGTATLAMALGAHTTVSEFPSQAGPTESCIRTRPSAP